MPAEAPDRDQRAHASKCASRLPGPQPSVRSLSDPGPPRGAPPASGRTVLICCKSNPVRPATPTELPPASPFPRLPPGARGSQVGAARDPARSSPGSRCPGRPRGRAPRRAGEAQRPPGGWGRAGRPGEEVAGRGGGGGEPRRQGGGDSAWKGRCTRICMKHRLGTGGSGSGSGSAAHGPDRPRERASER